MNRPTKLSAPTPSMEWAPTVRWDIRLIVGAVAVVCIAGLLMTVLLLVGWRP